MKGIFHMNRHDFLLIEREPILTEPRWTTQELSLLIADFN